MLVACATVAAAISIVRLFSLGVAALTAESERGGRAQGGTRTKSRLNPLTVAVYACVGTAGLFALYGLYLIIPQFH